MVSEKNSRWDEIRRIHIESATAYRILGGLVLVGLGVWLGANLFARDPGYGTNLYTEFISIAVTVFIIDILNRRRDDQRREQELKEQLLREARSPEPAIARNAFHQMKDLELIYGEDSILQGADLSRARPRRVTLDNARLDGANLWSSDFSGSTLYHSVLDNANLMGARFEEAKMIETSMRNANLQWAKLDNADLVGVDLTGASLEGANFSSAHLYLPENNSRDVNNPYVTILPNGDPLTARADLERFTNRLHPEFWEPI